jgi:hypothetical protein
MLLEGLIKNLYDKQKSCPVFENTSKFKTKLGLIFNSSSSKNYTISHIDNSSSQYDRFFNLLEFNSKQIKVRPLICFEFFFFPLPMSKADLYIAFVNDSLYMKYFADLLFLHSKQKTLFSSKPILYSSNGKKLRSASFFDNLEDSKN